MSKSTSRDLLKQQKKQLRTQIRQLRNEITGSAALKASKELAARLKTLSFYAKARQVACYISFDGEIGTQPIIEMLLQDKQQCYLPKLRPRQSGLPNRLWFMPYQTNCKLKNNALGIPEVDLTVNHALAISKLDLILMPLVAFDVKGNRLGMGGGYYDASLAHLLDKPQEQRPLCIGIAYQQQMLAQLPKQKWDFPLDGVITQSNFYAFNIR